MGNSILKHLDEPVRILSFSISDLVGYLAPFFVGSLFDSLFVVPLIGIASVFLAKRMLKRFPRFHGIRFLYWFLPTRRFNRMLKVNLPPSNKHLWVK